jgi:hypothetical protein
LIAWERAVDRSKYGQYSANSREMSFEIPIRPESNALLDVKPQLTSAILANSRNVTFHIHFVPDFIPGFDFPHDSPSLDFSDCGAL